jgi:hypothetical protein
MKYAFVGKFVRWAYKFTTLRELQVIAVLSHPHACYGGKRWKTHDNTTQDIMAMFERLKPISNQEVKIMFDVGLPKTRGDGLYIDMSSYEFDRWIQTYQKEFQESRNRRVRRTSKRLKKAPSYVRT